MIRKISLTVSEKAWDNLSQIAECLGESRSAMASVILSQIALEQAEDLLKALFDCIGGDIND